jgi:hypothetical protein
MDCDIDPLSLACHVCGAIVSSPNTRRNCGNPTPGLGDIVAAGLTAFGVTKERVSAAIGRPCGCGERQEAMNDIGARYLGIGRVDPPT